MWLVAILGYFRIKCANVLGWCIYSYVLSVRTSLSVLNSDAIAFCIPHDKRSIARCDLNVAYCDYYQVIFVRLWIWNLLGVYVSPSTYTDFLIILFYCSFQDCSCRIISNVTWSDMVMIWGGGALTFRPDLISLECSPRWEINVLVKLKPICLPTPLLCPLNAFYPFWNYYASVIV